MTGVLLHLETNLRGSILLETANVMEHLWYLSITPSKIFMLQVSDIFFSIFSSLNFSPHDFSLSLTSFTDYLENITTIFCMLQLWLKKHLSHANTGSDCIILMQIKNSGGLTIAQLITLIGYKVVSVLKRRLSISSS